MNPARILPLLTACGFVACVPKAKVNVQAKPKVVSGTDILDDENPPPSPLFKKSTLQLDGSVGGGRLCTAVIISKKNLLSAKHCANNGDIKRVIFRLKFGTHLSSFDPKYDQSSLGGALIIAQHPDTDLLLLTMTKELPEGYEPAPFLPAGSATPGRMVHPAGYGFSAKPGDESKEHLEHLRWGTMKVDKKMTEPVELFTAKGDFSWKFKGLTRLIPSPSNTCTGDSGGPVFADVDGTWGIAGITSGSSARCDEETLMVDVGDYLGWINDETQKHTASENKP